MVEPTKLSAWLSRACSTTSIGEYGSALVATSFLPRPRMTKMATTASTNTKPTISGVQLRGSFCALRAPNKTDSRSAPFASSRDSAIARHSSPMRKRAASARHRRAHFPVRKYFPYLIIDLFGSNPKNPGTHNQKEIYHVRRTGSSTSTHIVKEPTTTTYRRCAREECGCRHPSSRAFWPNRAAVFHSDWCDCDVHCKYHRRHFHLGFRPDPYVADLRSLGLRGGKFSQQKTS